MTGVLVGLVGGVGLFLIWWSCWVPEPGRRRRGVAAGPVQRLRDELTQAGYETISPAQVVAASVIAGMLVFLLAYSVSSVEVIGLCFAVMAGWAPIALVRLRARARRSQLRDVWPDAVDNIASSVRAGMALPEALAQLEIRGPVQLRPAFAAFAQDYRSTGRFGACLDALKVRLADPVGDRLVESLRIAREVGGSDLGVLLRTLSAFLREDARTRAEMETRQSWTVSAARLAVAAPWIVLAMLSTRSASVTAYGSATGAMVLLTGAGVTFVAYRLMIRIGRLPEDVRVLR